MSDGAARQAAWLLHELAPPVQRAVLAKFAKADADRLKSLLSELAELRIPSTWGRRLNATVNVASQASPEQKVEQLTVEAIAGALEGCAPITIAQFIRARQWPWKAQLLDRLPEPTCGAVAECLRREDPALPSAVVRRLCERVCQQAERAQGVSMQARTIGPAGLMSQIGRLFGWTR